MGFSYENDEVGYEIGYEQESITFHSQPELSYAQSELPIIAYHCGTKIGAQTPPPASETVKPSSTSTANSSTATSSSAPTSSTQASSTPPPSSSSSAPTSSSSTPSSSSSTQTPWGAPPASSSTDGINNIFSQMVLDSGENGLVQQFTDTASANQEGLSKTLDQQAQQQLDAQQTATRNFDRASDAGFQRAGVNQQRLLKGIEQSHTDTGHAEARLNQARAEGEQRTYRLRSQSGLLAEGEPETPKFAHEPPPGYRAFMQSGPRGRSLYVYSDKILEASENPEEGGPFVDDGTEGEEVGTQKTAQGALAHGKKASKQAGDKDVKDIVEEAEEAVEGEEGDGKAEGVAKNDATSSEGALKRSMGAKAAKTKGPGGESQEDDVREQPWQNYGEAIERHTVMFGNTDHASSAQSAARASMVGTVIAGAGQHLRVQGTRLNYSGTSHHGLPIPRGDEALEIGRDQVVVGSERDMGQLGVESVFVNGRRFELANADDSRKLQELMNKNPDLQKTIQGIRETMQETRYYRTCKGLQEDGPGGRA